MWKICTQQHRISYLFALIPFLLVLSGSVSAQSTWFVDDDSPNDPSPANNAISDPLENGTSIHPFDKLQEALNAAATGDEVIVQPGLYHERLVNYHGKNIHVHSTAGAAATTIDATGLGQNVIVLTTGEGPGAILDGFTITGGNAPGSGGGIVTVDSSPTIRNCIMTGNNANIGGGMHVRNGAPTVINCQFINNSANWNSAGCGSFNNAGVFIDCLFQNNTAGINGGAVRNHDGGGAHYVNCSFINNQAANGGGIYNMTGANAQFINCLIAGNTASSNGGGIYNRDPGSPSFTNCTLADNDAAVSAGGSISAASATPLFVNSIIWGNTVNGTAGSSAQVRDLFGTATTINTSCVEGGWSGAGGIGIFSSNPLFQSPLGGDYSLQSSSPCIDSADNAAVPSDLFDLDSDGNVTEPLPFDLAGQSRIVGTIVDMGPYENQPASIPCPEDITPFGGNGMVNIDDLVALLNAFGPCPAPPSPCLGDLTPPGGNGTVNIDDLVAILNAFGSCP